jgi:dynein heavy chain
MAAKQQVQPLQTIEIINIRRKTASFDIKQYDFREKFRKDAPFKFDSAKPYDLLDSVGSLILSI